MGVVTSDFVTNVFITLFMILVYSTPVGRSPIRIVC